MKEKEIELRLERGTSSGILLIPDRARQTAVVLAHGAGGTMNAPFINFFHRGIAEAGYPCLKFNFLYSQQRRRYPDPQPLLLACFEKAMETAGASTLVLGGKSMGGRMASYIGNDARVSGLFYLGYPLHPPGKIEQLRDQHLYSIRKPMFFASGTRDPFARIDLLKSTIERIGPLATTCLIEDGGHSFEVPKKSGRRAAEVQSEVLEALIRWLADL